MARMEWDAKELGLLAVDLRGAPHRMQRAAINALETEIGPMVAREMRRDAKGHQGNWFGRPGTAYNTPLEKHVSFERVGEYEIEVGIENKGAGKLAHIIVFGSVNNDPVYDHMAGPRRALPRVERLAGVKAEDSVLGDET
jgi:hypothetical protein